MRIARARALLVLTAVFFAMLSLVVTATGTLPGDVAIRDALLGLASPAMLAVMRIVNLGGEWEGLLPGTLLLFAFPRARARWWVWVMLMIIAATAPDLLKHLVGRPRPYGTSLGFPSGHATAAAACFGALAYLAGSLEPVARRVVRVVAVLLILLVAIARVMLRAHWPSDVVGGIAFGLALALAAALIATNEQDPRYQPPPCRSSPAGT